MRRHSPPRSGTAPSYSSARRAACLVIADRISRIANTTTSGFPVRVVSLVIQVGGDAGAAKGIPAMLADPLNVRGKFSDGYDGRLDAFDRVNADDLLGAFRTPSLRCVAKRPSFTHTGQLRNLNEVVEFFNRGGASSDTTGAKEIGPLNLTLEEQAQLIAFLRTLSGPGPSADLLGPPPNP